MCLSQNKVMYWNGLLFQVAYLNKNKNLKLNTRKEEMKKKVFAITTVSEQILKSAISNNCKGFKP